MCYQNHPDSLLPEPLRILRRVDSAQSVDPL